MTTLSDIVSRARTYKGTRFVHMGRTPGSALDCAGVLVCCARDEGLVSPDFDVPPYLQKPTGNMMLEWCDKYMGGRVPKDQMRPGHALVMVVDKDPQHLGILGDYKYGVDVLSIIHAANNAHPPRVIETRLMWTRVQRFVAAYRFPGVTE